MTEAVVDDHEEHTHRVEASDHGERRLSVHQTGELDVEEHSHGDVFCKHEQVERGEQVPCLPVLHVEEGEYVNGCCNKVEGNLETPSTFDSLLRRGTTTVLLLLLRWLDLNVCAKGCLLYDQEQEHEDPVRSYDRVDPVAMGIGENGQGDHSRSHDTQVPETLDDVCWQDDASILAAQTIVGGEGENCVNERENAETNSGQDGRIEWVRENGSCLTQSQLNGIQLDDKLWS